MYNYLNSVLAEIWRVPCEQRFLLDYSAKNRMQFPPLKRRNSIEMAILAIYWYATFS